jgi:hypothetical protein
VEEKEMESRTSVLVEMNEKLDRLLGTLPPPPPANPSLLSRLARLWRRYFVRFDPYSIPVGQPLTEEQMEMLQR